ncbi:MAG: hypothetical protein BWY68_00066 [bacterium ADurb.Bin400]|nr:MAG: hypothetical protein BWY68_00066 [bacterium ADurb.Bin400]
MESTNITIICPHCQHNISIDEALSHQIEDRFKKEFEEESRKKEAELAAQKKALDEEKKKIDEEIAVKLESEKKRMWVIAQEKATEKVRAEADKEAKFLKEELEEKQKKLEAAQQTEMELRKEKNRLEEAKREFEIEKQRQLDAERTKIREDAEKTYAEQHRLKDLEKEKVIQDLKKSLEDAQRKAQQGSQQMQGEVLEVELEETLRAEFPIDKIAPVPKGINGADVIQQVKDQRGRVCGSIAWESKRTKAWTEGWVQKLKDDQRKVKAEIAILVSTVLPDGITEAGYYNGVYVTTPKMALGLAKILRRQIIEVAGALALEEGKSEKKDVVYNYLLGSEFRGRIESFIESAIAMKASLDREKRAYTKIWAEREKLIDRIETSMAGLYGDIKGIAGNSLPHIKSLELEAGEDELEDVAEAISVEVEESDGTAEPVAAAEESGSQQLNF